MHGEGQRNRQHVAHFRHRQPGKLIRFCTFFPCSSCWMLASQAWAIIDKGICRYQLCQKRTSYSSSPTSPLASSLHCSTVERLEATRTFVSNDVLAGT